MGGALVGRTGRCDCLSPLRRRSMSSGIGGAACSTLGRRGRRLATLRRGRVASPKRLDALVGRLSNHALERLIQGL